MKYRFVLAACDPSAPSAQLVKIENSNHYIQVDQAPRFVAEVDGFMKR